MNCPSCGTPIDGVATRGPSDHFLDPCGCRATTLTAREFATADRGRGLATDGGIPNAERDARAQTIDVYLGKVCNAWGRGDELVAGSMAQAKADIEDRARELASFIDDADLPDEPEWRDHAVEDGTQVWDVEDWQIAVQTHQIETQPETEDCAVCGGPVEADPATGDATVTADGLAHAECATHDETDVLPDGGMVESPDLYPVSVRVEVADAEVTWHTSDTAYERLANRPSGNLVTNIEDAAEDRDGSLFDVVVASSGAFWIMEADDA